MAHSPDFAVGRASWLCSVTFYFAFKGLKEIVFPRSAFLKLLPLFQEADWSIPFQARLITMMKLRHSEFPLPPSPKLVISLFVLFCKNFAILLVYLFWGWPWICCVAEAGLELLILLPGPPKCWNYRHFHHIWGFLFLWGFFLRLASSSFIILRQPLKYWGCRNVFMLSSQLKNYSVRPCSPVLSLL